MPLYQYACTCGERKDVFHSISASPEVLCAKCGNALSKEFAPTSTLCHVRGSTPSKAWKESRVRRKRNAELGVKQIERYGGTSKLVPNVGGEEVGSWKDAAAIAAEQGKDTAGYSKLIEAEKHQQNSRGIDERKWKAAKEELRVSG